MLRIGLGINAGIWRYHPARHKFEVFAEGTSNPWGIAFDEHGQLFETACVIPHLYQVVQGGRFERQAGSHFNPYTYDDIKTIADHRHYLGDSPHAGNGRSGDAGGGHAHSGALIYQGGAWPKEYAGSLFMNNIHGARLNRDILEPKGSGFVGHHAPDFLFANDSWSQIINLKTGPDGQVYFIDWYDRQQCHHNGVNVHDRSNGRIFKLSYGDPKPVKVDLRTRDTAGLFALLDAKNEWYASHALRRLHEQGPNEMVATAARFRVGNLEGIRDLIPIEGLDKLPPGDPVAKLRIFWALHANLLSFEDTFAVPQFDPHVRAWAVRFATEDKSLSKSDLDQFRDLATSDPSPTVRLAIASALQRLPLDQRWPIIEALVMHGEDASDHNLPLMYWYALEPLAAADPSRALTIAAGAKVPKILPFTVRRVAAIGTPAALATLVDALGKIDGSDARRVVLGGMVEALKGRKSVDRPVGWPDVFAKLLADGNPEVRSQAMSLALTFGDVSALAAFRGVLADSKAERGLRAEALAGLVKARDAGSVPTLQALVVSEPTLRGPAIRALAAFDDPGTAGVILGAYPGLAPTERRDALNTLASRPGTAKALLDAVGSKAIPSTDISADLIRQLRNLKDSAIDTRIGQVWGVARETSGDRARQIGEAKARLLAKAPRPPDVPLGRAVFAKTCGQCHVLFGTGGNVGPELTGSNRADLDYLLVNIYDPSALIGKDYQAHVMATKDGRILTGIVRAEDKDAVTLVTANESLIVPKSDIEDRRLSEASMMPEGLWAPLDDHEIRSLVAYLASPVQTPMLATADNVRGFFNGRDLAGWDGTPGLWKVEGNEIVGRTTGLGRNEFLRSDLSLGDFRLTLQVKLVANGGNSGIQFRGESLPGGEVKGYQADVGAGWWGKLYEEHGRGLLWDKSGEPFVKSGDWNTYEVLAIGPKIRTFINGQACVTLDDPPARSGGSSPSSFIRAGATEVRFKDIKLELDPRQ